VHRCSGSYSAVPSPYWETGWVLALWVIITLVDEWSCKYRAGGIHTARSVGSRAGNSSCLSRGAGGTSRAAPAATAA
jgi:hypothetical protein